MHIFFSGIGGAGIGPLALVALQAGYEVSGSDKQDSNYITYLREHGITNIHIGQDTAAITAVHNKQPIDWFVYSSALPLEDPHHPELTFCHDNGILMTKRDELLTKILADKNLKLIAVAGTHGKTTTSAMTVWLLKQLGVTFSYLLPAKTIFADMGAYVEGSEYFIYEADEFDRNFLAYNPVLSLITGIDWDHPDIYPTRAEYNEAFRQFLSQSQQTFIWQHDASLLSAENSAAIHLLNYSDYPALTLPGEVNRQNAALVAEGIHTVFQDQPLETLYEILNRFPGVSRRFEQLRPGLFSDYAHTPPKIAGALQLGHEVAGDKLVVVYEGLHNTRQHFIREELATLFQTVKQLYIVPSYLAREDQSLKLLSPQDIKDLLNEKSQQVATPAQLDSNLRTGISHHLQTGDTVLCLSAGGGNSLDEWLRRNFV